MRYITTFWAFLGFCGTLLLILGRDAPDFWLGVSLATIFLPACLVGMCKDTGMWDDIEE